MWSDCGKPPGKALAHEPERTALLLIAGIQRAIGLAEEQQIAMRLGPQLEVGFQGVVVRCPWVRIVLWSCTLGYASLGS